jgi:hypothetical protein
MADQTDRPEPDHSEDPRRQDEGEGGYPEATPEGTAPDAGTGEPDPAARAGADRAPDTSSPEESDPGTATGNPDAAGG